MIIDLCRTVAMKLFLVVGAALALTGCIEERDMRDEVFYFVMPDRFDNGDTTNDRGNIEGELNDHGFDPTSQAFYHGGDLKGLIKRLPYIEELGVTSIWITPIFKNQVVSVDGSSAGYHGYWAENYLEVDPHLGTNEELRQFIDGAHARGIKVFFDIVVNHTADTIRYEECHNPDGSFIDGVGSCTYRPSTEEPYTPFLPEGSEFTKSPDWLNDLQFYHNRGDSNFFDESSEFGDFFGLDDLKTSDPVVVQGMVDIFKYWISEFRINGFRLDTVRHVDIEFWQQWTPQIRDHAASEGINDFFMFGEIFDGNPFNVSRYTTEGTIDSAVDFGLYFAMRDVFASNVGSDRLAEMFVNDDLYSDADSDASTLLSFISNHDVGRIAYAIRTENPSETEEQHLARIQLAYSLMYFGRGIPIIYYGDEQGFVGGEGDQLNREDMMPSLVERFNQQDLIATTATTADENFDQQHPMYLALREYKDVLDLHPALRQGVQYLRASSSEPGIFAFSRVLDSYQAEYLVLMNTSTTEQTISLAATADEYSAVYPFGGLGLDGSSGAIEVTVPPLSTVIYKTEEIIVAPSVESVTLDLTPGQIVKERFEIPATVTWSSEHPLPLTSVEFYVSVDGGDFEFASRDTSAPYRLIYNTGEIPNGAELTFRAVARDQSGSEVTSQDVSVEVGLLPGIEISFRRPATWTEEINIYYQNVPTLDAIAFPGVPMTPVGDDLYIFQFPDGATSAEIVISDSLGNFSNFFFIDRDQCYANGTLSDTCDDIPVNENPFDVPIFIRGSMNDWGISNEISFVGDNTFRGFVDLEAGGSYQFKIASEDWATVDLGGQPGDSFVSLGFPLALETPGLNIGIDIFDTSDYRFDLDVSDLAFPTLTVTDANIFRDAPLFVRGGFNDWGTADSLTYVGRSTYQAVVSMDQAGSYEFKVASEDWTQADFGVPLTAVTNEVAFGETQPVVFRGNNLVGEFEGRDYLFSLEVDDEFIAALTVVANEPFEGTPIFVRGGFNGWGTDNELAFQGAATYATDITIPANGYEFKIASEDWASVDLGSNSGEVVTVGREFTSFDERGANLAINIENDATYRFTLDLTRGGPSLTVSELAPVSLPTPTPTPTPLP